MPLELWLCVVQQPVALPCAAVLWVPLMVTMCGGLGESLLGFHLTWGHGTQASLSPGLDLAHKAAGDNSFQFVPSLDSFRGHVLQWG